MRPRRRTLSAKRPGEVLGRPVVQAPALARDGYRQQVRGDAVGVRLDLDAATGQAPAALVDGDPQGPQRAHDGAHLVADGDHERRRRRAQRPEPGATAGEGDADVGRSKPCAWPHHHVGGMPPAPQFSA